MRFINGKELPDDYQTFAFDGCHKIYLCANDEAEAMMEEYGYNIFPINQLPTAWKTRAHCGLFRTRKLLRIGCRSSKVLVSKVLAKRPRNHKLPALRGGFKNHHEQPDKKTRN